MNDMLTEFIKAKITGYQEPERSGTRRGDPIGLSLVKFEAALLSLTSMRQQLVARIVGVSYGVLRVWRTEDLYKKTIRTLTREFADAYVYQLISATMKSSSYEEGVGVMSVFSALSGFDSIVIFNDELLETILECAAKAKLPGWKNKALLYSLAHLWAVRKGLYEEPSSIIVEKQPGLTAFDLFKSDRYLADDDAAGGLAEALMLANIFAKPWDAKAEAVEDGLGEMLGAIGDVL